MPIEIKPVKTNKSSIDQPPGVESGIMPTMPASFLVVGKSGSGKSTVLYNLLTKPELLGDYFNFIFVFSPVKTDDILRQLGLPDANYITEFDEDYVSAIIDNLEAKIEEQGGLGKCGNKTKVLFIFDDILGKQKFLRGDVMKKLATANRHFNLSLIINSQYYKGVPPVVRTNVSSILMFPSSLSEIEKLSDENCEPNQSKKEFIDLVQHATSDEFSFLYLQKKAKLGERIRKNFDIVIGHD
jgi:hypothetical protein